MATDIDGHAIYRSLRAGLDCSWTFKELDKSTPRDWAVNIRSDLVSSHWGMVGTSEGKDEEETI